MTALANRATKVQYSSIEMVCQIQNLCLAVFRLFCPGFSPRLLQKTSELPLGQPPRLTAACTSGAMFGVLASTPEAPAFIR